MRLTKLLISSVLVVLAPVVEASTSTNYALPFASLTAGSALMTSMNYANTTALGEAITGTSTEAAKNVTTGFAAQAYGLTSSCILDLDGNGKIDALTDGLMIMRALFGLTGEAVTNNAIGAGASKVQWADIQPLLHYGALDIDGNGKADALTDGLLIIRVLFGLTGVAATNDVIGVGATRSSFTQIRDYLNSVCGAAIQ